MVLTSFRCELLLLLGQFACQSGATQTWNVRADLQNFVRVLRDPQSLFVGFVFSRDRFDFVGVECPSGNRNAFDANDLQLSNHWFLFLNIKVTETCYIICGQRQSRQNIKGAAAISEQRAADFHGDRFGLTALCHRSSRFSVFEIKFDLDSALAHPSMLQDQGALFNLNEWQVIIERERIARTNGWAALAGRFDSQGRPLPSAPFLEGKKRISWYDKVRLLFANENPGISDTMIRRSLLAQTQRQMALIAVAIERYRLKKGHIPSELSALVPEYLPALPRDGMDGKTLRYRLAPNGEFQLYSVGLDGKDNGGDPTPRSGSSRYHQIWDGRDAAWPTPATAEEAEKCLRLGSKE